MFDSILNRLKDKRILVLGFGREGKSTLRFLQKYLPQNEIGVSDKNASAFADFQCSHFHSGDDYLQHEVRSRIPFHESGSAKCLRQADV